MSLLRTVASTGAVVPKLYVEDVFIPYLTIGTGASLTVTTGIDLATKGGAIFRKGRSGATDWAVYDTVRGATYDLVTNSTAAQTTQAQGLTAFSTTGHTWGTLAKINTSAATYVDYVLAKAPKFFDIITWTGDNTATGRVIPHALASTVGMVEVKATSTISDWCTWHRATTSGNYLKLNTTDAQSSTLANTYFGNGTTTVDPTSTGITVGIGLNVTGVTYVAYLYAHDTSANGIIQCGITDSTGNAIVNLGWEPQYVLYKTNAIADIWNVADSMRGMSVGSNTTRLFPNLANAESNGSIAITATSTGFNMFGANASTYIYMAIRRPMKTPTSGTEVYNAIARTGTTPAVNITGVGFAPDLLLGANRDKAASMWTVVVDKMRGTTNTLTTNSFNAEDTTSASVSSFNMDGVTEPNGIYLNSGGSPYINYFFKRAKGFFDQVCYTGTGVATTVPHNLGAVPELMIVKSRSVANNWDAYSEPTGNVGVLNLNDAGAVQTLSAVSWNSTTPTSRVFSLGTNAILNANTTTYVAYLFATLAGISKVGSYTGNGTSQTIACGFTTGARFILIKRTDNTGDWYIWDTVRGIVAANDPHLSLNTAVAEVTTDDSVDPGASGFIVNQVTATNINVTGANYIFLAIA